MKNGFKYTDEPINARLIEDFLPKPNRSLCLTTVVFPDKCSSSTIDSRIIQQMKKIDSEHIFYPIENLHITVKNIFSIGSTFDENIVKIIKKSLQADFTQAKLKVAKLKLQELIICQDSVLLKVHGDSNYSHLKSFIEDRIRDLGINNSKEVSMHSSDTAHITLCRFQKKPSSQLLEYLDSIKDIYIGELLTDTISLITCDYLCSQSSRKELLSLKLNY